MARDEVPAEAVAEAQAALEVHAAAGVEPAEPGAREGLGRQVEGELAPGRSDAREARAADGDAFARRDLEAGAAAAATGEPPSPGVPGAHRRRSASTSPVNIARASLAAGPRALHYQRRSTAPTAGTPRPRGRPRGWSSGCSCSAGRGTRAAPGSARRSRIGARLRRPVGVQVVGERAVARSGRPDPVQGRAALHRAARRTW